MTTNIWGDVASGPQRLIGEITHVEVGESDLNGRLHQLLVGLDVDLTGLAPVSTPASGPYLVSRQTDHPTTLNELPPAKLVAYTQHNMSTAQKVVFSCPADSYRADHYEESLRHPEGICISLWDVPGSCPVLAIELLTHKDRPLSGWYPELKTADWATDIMQDFQPTHPLTDDGQLLNGFAGMRPVIHGWLETVGLSIESTVASWLGLPDHGPLAEALPSLVVRSTETIRSRALIEGLYVKVEADTERTIPQLTNGPREAAAEFEQAWGALWEWKALELVDEPAQPGSTLAVREDVRAVVLNVDALSVEHHYDGTGGKSLVYEVIPYVAYKASLARDYWEILDLLRTREEQADLKPLLQVTERIRARGVQRSLLRREVQRSERFKEWTFGSQLRSALFALSQNATDTLTDDLGLAAGVVDEILRTKHEERERQAERDRRDEREKQVEARRQEDLERQAKIEQQAKDDEQKRLDRESQAERDAQLQIFAAIIAVVVSLFSVGSLFPALAAIPSRAEDTLLGGWVVPAVITGVLMLLVMLLGTLLHIIWTKNKRKKRTPHNKSCAHAAG